MSSAVVVIAHRAFKGDPAAWWSKGEYSVAADEATANRYLFQMTFALDSDFLYTDEGCFTVRANPGIMLSPRR